MNKKLEIIKKKINYNYYCLASECPNSCCGPFYGVQKGITSVEGRTFSEIILSNIDLHRLQQNGYQDKIEKTSEGYYRMRLHQDGSCQAFRNGLCSIHSFRPTLCRAFPFYIDMFAGLCAITDCPGLTVGETPIEELQEEINAAKDMYSFWIDWINR